MNIEQTRTSYSPQEDAAPYFELGQALESVGNLEDAATAYDRAYGLMPHDAQISIARQRMLDDLAVVKDGLVFRYIPAGTFLMGSETGDPDERPIHPIELDGFWMAERPITWAAYCDLMDWEVAPHSMPKPPADDASDSGERDDFVLYEENKIRRYYCRDANMPDDGYEETHPSLLNVPGHLVGNLPAEFRRMLGRPDRQNPNRPLTYDTKPMVSISWQAAAELAHRLSSGQIEYRLPTEAQWEKAARGGLIGKRYAWGDAPPTPELCDFDHFGRDEYFIRPSHEFAPNGYGLYGMCGGVWEWTTDWYDAEYYRVSPLRNPAGPATNEHTLEKVLRGGSWSDCAEAVTVSYRMARASRYWRGDAEPGWGYSLTPNFGFRLCRVRMED